MRSPLIALNGLYFPDDPMLWLRLRYADSIRRAGGIPVALTPLLDADPESVQQEIDAVLSRVDGLLLTGGDDFRAEAIGLGATHPAAEITAEAKQQYDLALTSAALARDIPVLGICYGMQCLGLAGGATLWQDLPSQRPGRIAHAESALHPVRAREGTKLAEVVGLDPVQTVSRHHQALRTVPPPWIVSALDDENLTEAIEHPGRRFALGVQWHPELSPGEPAHDALFGALISAARLTPETR